jgi:hypothetical protein
MPNSPDKQVRFSGGRPSKHVLQGKLNDPGGDVGDGDRVVSVDGARVSVLSQRRDRGFRKRKGEILFLDGRKLGLLDERLALRRYNGRSSGQSQKGTRAADAA